MGLGAALALAACAPSPQTTSAPTPPSESNAPAKSVKVGLVFDSAGRGDKSFNDSAYAGLERAKEELGAQIETMNSSREADYEKNLRAFADLGYDLIIANGLNQGPALARVAKDYPNLHFAIVDGTVEAPNVRSLHFAEEQGSFLVGYLAGLMSKTGKVGFVGGMEIPLIKKFEYGFDAGAVYANPKIEVLPAKYTGAWDNVDKAKEAANVLFGQGADVVYHAAGRAGLGVIRAAKEAGKYAIGVDSDQDYIEPGSVLTSMIKRVDMAVFATIKDTAEGKFSGGTSEYDLKQGGVTVSPMTYTKDKVGEPNLAKLSDVTEKLKSGEIVAPKTEAEYQAFLARVRG